jgi:ABC-2 type transport system ATP-binding protein
VTTPLVEAIDVHKRYGTQPALNGVSLAVHAGEIVGLLGPNGAGKTTMLSILATVMRPDAGHVRFAQTVSEPRPSIGLVPQSLALYPALTAAQNVWHFARMQGLSRHAARLACARVLVDIGLAERSHQRAAALSGGMQRRLNLACGIVHRPAVLLLDEPTVGVDLESREQLLAQIRGLRDAGAAVLYSTHYMEEAERLCDRVVLVDRGRVVAAGTVEKLLVQTGGRERGHGHLAYRGQVADGANGNGVCVAARAGAVPNLADVFVALTGHPLPEGLHE